MYYHHNLLYYLVRKLRVKFYLLNEFSCELRVEYPGDKSTIQSCNATGTQLSHKINVDKESCSTFYISNFDNKVRIIINLSISFYKDNASEFSLFYGNLGRKHNFNADFNELSCNTGVLMFHHNNYDKYMCKTTVLNSVDSEVGCDEDECWNSCYGVFIKNLIPDQSYKFETIFSTNYHELKFTSGSIRPSSKDVFEVELGELSVSIYVKDEYFHLFKNNICNFSLLWLSKYSHQYKHDLTCRKFTFSNLDEMELYELELIEPFIFCDIFKHSFTFRKINVKQEDTLTVTICAVYVLFCLVALILCMFGFNRLLKNDF